MSRTILQVMPNNISEEKIIIYIVGGVVLFFVLRSFLRNPGQFTMAVLIRASLFILSIFYFFWDDDLISDERGLLGYSDDAGLPFGIWKYFIRQRFPFPKFSNQNTDVHKKSDDIDGSKKNPSV